MELMLIGFITSAAEKYPVILAIAAAMGMARMVLKPLMTFLHEFVLITETKKDDEILSKVETSKAYKTFLFVLDYVFSLKLKKPSK